MFQSSQNAPLCLFVVIFNAKFLQLYTPKWKISRVFLPINTSKFIVIN